MRKSSAGDDPTRLTIGSEGTLGIITEFALRPKRLRTAMTKLRDYIEGQSAHLVNYGLRHRQGKPIGTSTTEGLANTLVNQRMNKLQQMRWSAVGAHAVVTMRAHHFNSLESAAKALRAAA